MALEPPKGRHAAELIAAVVIDVDVQARRGEAPNNHMPIADLFDDAGVCIKIAILFIARWIETHICCYFMKEHSEGSFPKCWNLVICTILCIQFSNDLLLLYVGLISTSW